MLSQPHQFFHCSSCLDRVTQLEVAVSYLEAQLTEQEADSNNVISIWQENCTSLEEQKRDLSQKLEEAGLTERALQQQLHEKEQALDEAREKVRNGEEALETSQSK
jgi:chromosome segregation ATPase